MSNLSSRIQAFSQLGQFLTQFSNQKIASKERVIHNNPHFDVFKNAIVQAKIHNGWFTEENVLFACESWAASLNEENLTQWLSKYDLNNSDSKTIAIIMAGNIPLVGFHDFLSVLISGNKALIKQSSNDQQLLPILCDYLIAIAPEFKDKITFTKEKLTDFDAVIATGSNNTARYFDYYFGQYPSIIRKNRNSVAVLTGKETEEQLKGLADDIFQYFGLGCRSVSKLFVPKDYDFDALFNAVYKYKDIIHNAKYANNYDYNKAVYLMSLFELLENGFLMLKEDDSYSSPIATLFYEYYDDADTLKNKLGKDDEKIQCIVAHNFIANEISFGHTQLPSLQDYADGIDSISFLINL